MLSLRSLFVRRRLRERVCSSDKLKFIINRIVETPASDLELEKGDVLVAIEKFAYTANNIFFRIKGL